MKKFIFALTFILAPCVNAGEILPYLYARKFCEYRSFGISAEDARKAAIDDAYVSSGKSTMVNYNGKMVSSDVIKSAIAVTKMCPQYLD
jgi:hypothetical protein